MSRELLRWLLLRALTPTQRRALLIMAELGGQARGVDLAGRSNYKWGRLVRLRLIKHVGRGEYRLTELGRELASLLRELGGQSL